MTSILVALLLLPQGPPVQTPEEKLAPAPEKRADLNLLGKTNTESGESRRNENVAITLLDNNALKENIKRLGTTATLITEFKSEARFYGAEYGNAPAGSVHLGGTRPSSGVRGSATWSHNNSIFSARSFFQVGGVRPARDNQFGIRLLAPLTAKTHFSFDGSRQMQRGFVNGNILVPRADERSCLSPDPAACALINRWLRAWPSQPPNLGERQLNTNAAQRIDTDNTTSQLDHWRGKDRFTARHVWTTQAVDAFQLVAGQNPDTTTKSHDARLTWSRNLGAGSVLDVTTGFNRSRSLLVPEANAVGPQVVIGTAWEKLGPGSSIPVDRVQNRYRTAARYTRQQGRHQLSLGGEFARLQLNGREASSNRGNIYFRNDFGRDAITNFRLGAVTRYSFGAGELMRGFRRWETHAFVQDNWRVNDKLTVSLGVRYEPVMGIQEVNRLSLIPFRCDCNNLAPTVGLARRLGGRWGVLRAAYSTQFGEVFPATLQQVRWNQPAFQKVEVLNPPLLDLLRGVSLGGNQRAITFDVPPDLVTPYSHQYNAMWEIPVGAKAGKLQLGYVGTRTWKLLLMNYNNRAVIVPGIPQTTATINDRRPDPRYYDFRQITNGARAYFDAARVNYTLPNWRRLTLDTAYWFSKAIDTGATYVNIAAGDDALQGYSQTATGVAADLRGVSNFHQTHALLVRMVYSLPQMRQARHVTKDWRLSAVFLSKSGLPFTVFSGSDAPGYGNADGVNGDRPHLRDTSILGRTFGDPDTAPRLLPRSAFELMQPLEPRGNLGTNTFRRGGIHNLNASLERRFILHGDRALSFRAEGVNVMNTPQFAEPNADLSSPAFGQITNTLNDGRTFRFTLRLDF
ncbi:MAG: TonB-dependent receptor [Bryobacteraceae bacterium]|nr:TonB-dependent receptor [Bryobacteraceae bacterium]